MVYGNDGIRVNIMALNSCCVGIMNVGWLCPTRKIFSHSRWPRITVSKLNDEDKSTVNSGKTPTRQNTCAVRSR